MHGKPLRARMPVFTGSTTSDCTLRISARFRALEVFGSSSLGAKWAKSHLQAWWYCGAARISTYWCFIIFDWIVTSHWSNTTKQFPRASDRHRPARDERGVHSRDSRLQLIFVLGAVQTLLVWILADFCSVRNLIDEVVCNRSPYKSPIRDPGDISVIGGNGEAFDLKGFAVLPVSLGSTLIWHEFGVVPNIPLEVFIVVDFWLPTSALYCTSWRTEKVYNLEFKWALDALNSAAIPRSANKSSWGSSTAASSACETAQQWAKTSYPLFPKHCATTLTTRNPRNLLRIHLTRTSPRALSCISRSTLVTPCQRPFRLQSPQPQLPQLK